MSNLRLAAIGCALALAPFSEAAAQALLRPPMPHPEGRLSVEAYLSQHRLTVAEARGRMDGVGARVVWAVAPSRTPVRERPAEHVSIGGFVEVTRDAPAGTRASLRSEIAGAELEVRPLRAPVAGMLEPVLGLGAGLMRIEETSHDSPAIGGMPLVARDVPGFAQSQHAVASSTHRLLAPSVGVLVLATPAFGLRLDIRELIATDDRARSTELVAGLRIRL